MLTTQSPSPGNQMPRPKPARRPLQQIYNSPLNFSAAAATPPIIKATPNLKPNPKLGWVESNKENLPGTLLNAAPAKIELFDASLAEELSAIRERMERLRLDKEKTEKMLRERNQVLEMQINEVCRRGEMQKMLEIEVDRLYRLKELRSSCMRISPIRSLREKEQEKIKEDKPQDIVREDMDEITEERTSQSSTSEPDVEK